MDFAFFNVKITRRFTSTFVAICSTNSHLFGFTPRRKLPPLDKLKVLVTTLKNQDDIFALIRYDEYGALAISYELIKTCNNTNIIVKTTGRYA